MTPATVYLVGAGPGDPGLITEKGLRCLKAADAVVFDRLVDKRLLDHVDPGAIMIDAGKSPDGGGAKQAEINSTLVSLGRQGKRVVRLKGGDPFVFGRGGEEAKALADAGVPFEVVPGVTSAVAAPAYAGIPLTHRGVAASFTVVTGREIADCGGSAAVAWDKLPREAGTLVILMGLESLDSIAEHLRRRGWSPDTQAALIRWGTEPCQRTVVGTLSDIVDRADQAGLTPPVVAVLGDVVGLREALRWFDNRPLFGKRVLVTRTRGQASTLVDALSQRGAEAIEAPVIQVIPAETYADLDDALGRLWEYDWAVFTSSNAIRVVFERLHRLGLDARAFGRSQVACIGGATAGDLRKRGIAADLVPDRFESAALIDQLGRRGIEGCKVLLPRTDIADHTLPEGLSNLGAVVDEVAAYRTVPAERSRDRVNAALSAGVDAVTFTSSSTVENLSRLLDGDLSRVSRATIACIGPVTAATAGRLGLAVDIVAGEHTIDGLVEALEKHFGEEDQTHEQLS